mgnify:FL=1
MTPFILRMIMVCVGIGLIILSFASYARRKVTEGIGLSWAAAGILIIICSTIPGLYGWSSVICSSNYIVLFVAFFMLAAVMYKLSVAVSLLTRRNQELAMQVSLLNQENERILAELKQITGKDITKI